MLYHWATEADTKVLYNCRRPYLKTKLEPIILKAGSDDDVYGDDDDDNDNNYNKSILYNLMAEK